jgi:hypothetical protein
VVKPVPSYLKLQSQDFLVTPPDVEECTGLYPICQAFTVATGWPLAYRDSCASDEADLLWSAPVNPGVGASPGPFRIELGRAQGIADIASAMGA